MGHALRPKKGLDIRWSRSKYFYCSFQPRLAGGGPLRPHRPNFDCLAFTIEMPFKDNANLSDLEHGWNGERSRKLGASVLVAVRAVVGG